RRAIPSVSLEPLDGSKPGDRDLFMEFFAKYLREMEKRQIAKNTKSLLFGDIPGCMLEVANGTIGGMCGLLEVAVRLMTYDKRDEFTREDLSSAADRFVADKKCKHERNPFRDGLTPLRIAA